MQKLKSFDQFSTEVKISQTRQIEEDAVAKRSDSAESFKNLLSEFKVTSIKELTEEQRVDFFTKLRDTEVNEAVELIEEGTRGQFGKIDKKGNIVSIYTHYDSYPENMLPLIKKGYKAGKNVDAVIKGGNSSGLEATPGDMNFYKDGSKNLTGSIANVDGYLRAASDEGGAEYVYLWDEANKEWLMADIYAKMELAPAFENLSISVNEAIKVEYKRDAKKVLTVYRNLFAKRLTDFGAMSNEATLGCIKYLFENAMEDANFHREKVISKHIKGFIGPFEVKMPGLGNYYIKIGATTTKRILDQYYSDIANAAGWSGAGIVEGTALYLESIKQEAMGQSLVSAFDVAFNESVVTEAYTEDDINIRFGFYGTIKTLFGEKTAKKLHDEGIKDLQKKYKLSEKEALLILNFQLGEKAAELIENGVADSAIEALEQFYGKRLKRVIKKEIEYVFGESVVTEAEVSSIEDFQEYATTVLQKAFGEEFDKERAQKVIDGILAKADGDYGTAVGMLTASLGS